MASECFVGVKPFERALVKLLSSDGVPLPRCSAHPLLSDEPPAPALTWERLHSEVHPAGTAAGGALPASRVQRKCWQIESLASLAAVLVEGLAEAGASPATAAAAADSVETSEARAAAVEPAASATGSTAATATSPAATATAANRATAATAAIAASAATISADVAAGGRRWHLVDFAGGCGPLGLPLAAMLPHCTVTIVELKARSLEIARGRAAAAGLTNVRFVCGDLGAFHEPFDVGLALHACGTASDLVLR
uniref:Methyltransferase domain-containing protein n=2 Tax=Emiliania huxleyi TaxID=2903 RepID=A0A0D3JIL2_EMIH1